MTFYYPGSGLGENSFTGGPTSSGWQPHNFLYGAAITVPVNGTATQISVRGNRGGVGTVAIKLGLYNSSGTLLAQSTSSLTGTTAQWADSGAISAALTAGTYYVFVSAADTNAAYYSSPTGDGNFANGDYASAMPASITIDGPETGLLYAVRVNVEEGGAQEEGDYTAGSSLGSAFSAIATAAGSITAGVGVSAAVSARAAAVASITEALEAGDADSAAQAAQRVFAAQVSTDAQYAAIAQAAAAIQAGLEAGEVWAAIAAAEAGLIAGAELGATFAGETESAQTAALEAGTEAAAQFLGAIAAFGLLESGASASDAYSAISVALAAINIGVVLDATFSATSSADASIVGATASVRSIRRMSASVRAIRPTATLN